MAGRPLLIRSAQGVVLVLITLTALTACSQGRSEAGDRGYGDEPAEVVRVAGSDRASIILTPRAAERIGIQTEPVVEAFLPGVTTPVRIFSSSALIYDRKGETWVYVASRFRDFVRERVTVVRLEGDRVVVEAGLAGGTDVVTVGAAELLGSEYGVEGRGQ